MVADFDSLEKVSIIDIIIFFFFLAFVRIRFSIETRIIDFFLQRQVDHVTLLHYGKESLGHAQLLWILLNALLIHFLEKLQRVRWIDSSVEILPFLLRDGIFDLVHGLLRLHDDKGSYWFIGLNLTIRYQYDIFPSFQAFNQA